MKPDFEIKYIEVQWYNKDTVTRVTESLLSLSPEYIDDMRCFQCETTIYPNTNGLRGQLAIRFYSAKKNARPYIELPNEGKHYLSSIQDTDTGKIWWIAKDFWNEEEKYWSHTGINIAGTLKLALHNQECHVLIGSVDFTRDQLETYLTSFKNDLWDLILDDSSSIQADKKTDGIGITKEIIESINRLIANAEMAANNPKSELREIQILKPRKLVRPVNRTFMEITSKSNQKFLTSRATTPSFNIPDNRYILFALERAFRIIKQISILSENKSRRYKDTTNKLQNQYESLTDTISVDRDLVTKDLKVLRERRDMQYWQDLQAARLNNFTPAIHSSKHQDLYIRTQGYSRDQETSENNGFFIEVFKYGEWQKINNKKTIILFDHNYPELTNSLLLNSEYRISGFYNEAIYTNVTYYRFSSIGFIELRETQGRKSAIEKFQEEREYGIKLNENGWTRKLTKNELEEQEKEKIALKNRMIYYFENQKSSEYVFNSIYPKCKKLSAVIKSLRQRGIKPSSHFPNSMTFVQNPHYQGIHSGYKLLREATNLTDDDLLFSLEKIDSIGLVNMPLLYERWCLIQIIKVLKESFRFIPKNDWKHQLIEAISTKNKNIRIYLSNPNTKRFITLTYEKELSNGRLPDFVIDLEWYRENDYQNQDPQKSCFVLDAKFYNKATFDRHDGLMGVVNNLYYKKDYSESENNAVFILHPCKDSLPERITAQEWGKYSFLGELPHNKQEAIPDHQYGAVYINPIDRLLYADELQRLLGLLLQYKLEDANTLRNARADDRTVSKPFCIRCGSANLKNIEKTAYFKDKNGVLVTRTPRSVWMQCNDCEHFLTFNHCKSTNTRLIKNGFYWTYHSSRAIEPFNNKCPNCGEWGAW